VHVVTVPAGLSPADDYRIEVRSGANRSASAHSGPFSIDAGITPPAITDVTVASSEWRSGSQQRVRWATEGEVAEVQIALRKGAPGINMALLGCGITNKGEHVVTVPTGLTPATDYRIAVYSATNRAACAHSGDVSIDAGSTPPAITNVTVVQPIWHGSSQQRIIWDTQGHVPTVSLLLQGVVGASFRHVTFLGHNIANTGVHVVTVPAGLSPADDYRIEVRSGANRSASAHSGPFSIDDDHRERCVQVALLLLGLPPRLRLPYAILRKVAMAAATE